jgi:putative ABC transport system permease protein
LLFASGDFFKTLGVPATIGRPFTAEDDVRGASGNPVAVISHSLWQRRFGGSPQVLGMSVTIERTPFTIIGVTPAGFFGTEVGRGFDVALPLGAEALIRGSPTFLKAPFDRFNYWLVVALRLKAGQSLEAATAVLRGMQPQIREGAQPLIERARVFEFLREPFTLTPIATGISPLRRVYRRPAGHPVCRRTGAARRVREHRQPSAGAGHGAAARAEPAARAWRSAVATDATAPH